MYNGAPLDNIPLSQGSGTWSKDMIWNGRTQRTPLTYDTAGMVALPGIVQHGGTRWEGDRVSLHTHCPLLLDLAQKLFLQ